MMDLDDKSRLVSMATFAFMLPVLAILITSMFRNGGDGVMEGRITSEREGGRFVPSVEAKEQEQESSIFPSIIERTIEKVIPSTKGEDSSSGADDENVVNVESGLVDVVDGIVGGGVDAVSDAKDDVLDSCILVC